MGDTNTGGPATATGAVATLLGDPSAGYQFSQWLEDASGTSNPTQITVNGYKIARAVFTPNTTGIDGSDIPLAFGLGVRPNPAVGPAEIEYAMPREAAVRLRVYDISGREVARLADGVQPAGRHVARWGTSGRARAGVYLVRYETPAGNWTQRVVMLR